MSQEETAAKTKPKTVYIVVRVIVSESPTFTTPERVFVDKADAQKFADERNRELRELTNPFQDFSDPESSVKGGEKAFLALLKTLKLPVPTKDKRYGYTDWGAWWNRHYFDMTDAQREAIWNALDKLNWYKVETTTLEQL